MIQKIISQEYRKAKAQAKLFLIMSILLMVPAVYYEYTIKFVHARNFIGTPSTYILFIWLSGFLFGSAIIYYQVIRKTEEVF